MKSIFMLASCLLLFCGSGFSQNKATDTLQTFYNTSLCGLNYVTASVVLGKKMEFNGLPFIGIDQPASLIISGIPAGAEIDTAFIWWDLTGMDTTGSVVVQNPNSVIDTAQGVRIGGTDSTAECWTIGASAFRADVTNMITGNGTYIISGLPTDSIANDTTVDVNGATLFIVYRDAAAPYRGMMVISDGYYIAKSGTFTQSISGISATDTSDMATAFMIVSDLQNETNTAVKMNNGSYQGITEEFWDYEERSTILFPGVSSSVFGLQVPNDCSNFIMIGLYYQYNTDNTIPTLTRNGDSISSSTALGGYQWNFNGGPISGATSQSYVATQAGTYSVTIDNGDGCLYTSDTVFISCIVNFTPSIFSLGATLSTGDSVGDGEEGDHLIGGPKQVRFICSWYIAAPFVCATSSYFR